MLYCRQPSSDEIFNLFFQMAISMPAEQGVALAFIPPSAPIKTNDMCHQVVLWGSLMCPYIMVVCSYSARVATPLKFALKHFLLANKKI